jgi:hypothetical protein
MLLIALNPLLNEPLTQCTRDVQPTKPAVPKTEAIVVRLKRMGLIFCIGSLRYSEMSVRAEPPVTPLLSTINLGLVFFGLGQVK